MSSGDPRYPSLRVSTWFLGEGALLANAAAAQLGLSSSGGSTGRIVPLDGSLDSPFADRHGGGVFGVRLSRALTSRFAAEINFDVTRAPVDVRASFATQVGITASSFENTFSGLLARIDSATTPVSVRSSGTTQDGDRRQVVATGAININLTTRGRVIPYATAGAGILWEGGDNPAAELEGQYRWLLADVPVLDEADRVRLVQANDDNAFVGFVGGGARLLFTERSGLRLDGRVHLGSRTVRTVLDAEPAPTTALPALAAGFFRTATNPSVVFSNNFRNLTSSLSGPPLDDVSVYEATGIVAETLVTIGYFWRF
jgi:hypothetical protein